ncbi:tail fiber domain-containing protein, partial [Rhizobium sp. LC145]|uniref:tail fiber domain-containing protein n=1 Tax=Rhizobium sp. LC145 TaxID=1120688 RepID=UPI000ACFDF0D
QFNNDVNQVLRNAQALSEYIQRLDNPSLGALASLTPAENTVPVFTGPETAAALVAVDFLAFLGFSNFMAGLRDKADVAALLTALEFSNFMAGLRTAANQADARTALGAQAALGYTPVNKAGDTMTGVLTGVASSAAFPPSSFLVPASTHATSRRASIQIGSWQLVQDVVGNGPTDFAFYNGSVGHRLRMFTGGQVSLLGNASPAGWMDISSAANATRLYISGYGINQGFGIVMRSGVAAGGGSVVFQNSSGSSIGTINHTNTDTTYGTTSDYRLKTNVEPLVSFTLAGDQFDHLDDAVLRVMAMRPVNFTWAEYPEAGLQTGFIAHELQQAAPHAVGGQKDAKEDIGTATIPEKVIPAQVIPGDTVTVIYPETGEPVEIQTPDREVPEQIIPAQVFEDVRNGEIEGAEWVKTGTRPVYQAVDHGRLTPDLVAAVQSLTLMVLEQQAEMKAMAERISALELA